MTKKPDNGHIHENVHSLQCSVFMMDYERATLQALGVIIPGTDLRHCWFHFKQANLRNATKLGKHFMEFLQKN